MPWEQFGMSELDGRLQLIAGYLANRLDGKYIVDLNCGTAPLLAWLPKPNLWSGYYGNDTSEEFIYQARRMGVQNTTFECIPDSAVPKRLAEDNIPVDILLCLGYAARLNEYESQTLDESLEDIVRMFGSGVVILEYWSEIYHNKGSRVPELLEFLRDQGYEAIYTWELSAADTHTPYHSRTIHIFERAVWS